MNIQAISVLDELKKKVYQAESNIISAKRTIEKLEREMSKPDYTQVDGIVGVFDGFKMKTEDGTEYDVPANYAAKTKLVFGDTLKLIEEDGKKLFKQIDREPRIKVEGILAKKEGDWYILTDTGSYRVSDTAAEFQGARLNSKATAFIPANKKDVPFAAIDHIEGFGVNTKPAPVATTLVKPETPKKEAPVVAKSVSAGTKAAPVQKPTPQSKSSPKATSKSARTEKPKPRKPAPSRPQSESRPAPKSNPAPRPATSAPKAVEIDDDDLV